MPVKCKLHIDNLAHELDVEGDFSLGNDEVLYRSANSVISACDWEEAGFDVIDLFEKDEFNKLHQSISSTLKAIFAEVKIDIPANFKIQDYHRWVSSAAEHHKVISKTRFLTKEDFDLDLDSIAARISKIINHPLGLKNPLLEEEIIILRISRPNSLDINPLHRDGYLDLWQNVLNVWIPIEGCNEQSSLPVAPASHFWNEKFILRTAGKGASINGLTYHVPGIAQYKEDIKLIRPNPKVDQALIFTPFLVHGAAINQNKDTTRLSLELRLCSQR